MRLAALALLALSAPAAAAPCDVRIVHAPDDVRAEVTRWLLDEPQCGPSLEVRIVPTTEGLYVFARDANGRVRERVVPDAQSAGVLIASWAAADSDEATATPVVPAMPVAAAPAQVMDDDLSYPRPAPVDTGPVPAPSRPAKNKTLALQLFGNDTTLGLRAEIDVWRRGPWSASIVSSFAHDGHTDYENLAMDELDYYDLKALAAIGVAADTGRIQMRWSFGAGVVGTYVKGVTFFYQDMWEPAGYFQAVGVSPTLESTATLAVRMSDRLHFEAGPLVTLLPQRYYENVHMGHTEIESRNFVLMAFAGLRYSR